MTRGYLLRRLGWSLSVFLLSWAPPLAAEPLDVELSGDVASPGPEPAFRISADGGHVVFQTATEPRAVLSVPIEGGTAATLTPPDTEAVMLVDVAPDGSRVLMTARKPGSETELFSAPLLGGEVVTLNPPLASDLSAFPGPITPDSSRVIYGTRGLGTVELFAVPLAGGASVPLNLPDEPLDGPVDLRDEFLVGPGSDIGVSVLFERLPEDVNEDPDPVLLFSTPLVGGLPTVLHERGWFNDPFRFTSDGQRVVYDRAGELFSVGVAGGTPERLSADLPLPGSAIGFAITPDDARVILAQDVEQGFQELYSVPTAGGETERISHPDGRAGAFPWEMAPDGERVAFAQRVGDAFEGVLFSVGVEGGDPTPLSPPLTGLAAIQAIRVSAAGGRVVYAAEQDTPNLMDLYSVPIEGGAVTRLGGPIARNGTNGSAAEGRYRITPDGTRVVFVVDTTDNIFDGITELHSVPIAGGVVTKLSGPMEEGEQINSFGMEISPDSRHVVFRVTRPRSFGTAPELHSARLPPEVRIDIQPRKDPNKLPKGRRVMIAVAIHGSDEVDVTALDVTTLAFGPDGAAAERKAKTVDVDDDGFDDLVTRYRRNETGIEGGDAEACLSGSYDGFDFLSCDAIVAR